MSIESKEKISLLENMLKKSKNSTSPISIRVKDSTLAVLNIYAEKYDMKVGTIINQILDSYADAYNDEIEEKYGEFNREMHTYLTKIANQISKLSDEELAQKIYNEIDGAKKLPTSVPSKLVQELNKINRVNPEKPYAITVGTNNIIASNTEDCANGSTFIKKDGEVIRVAGTFVPAKKWLVIVYMFHKYFTKRTQQLRRNHLGNHALINCSDIIKSTESKELLPIKIADELANFIEPDESNETSREE